MDMQVDANLIRSERIRRAWSQEQLATVSGLSLRTVHRIEAGGTASYESLKAIASVLEIPVTTLQAKDAREMTPTPSRRHPWKRIAAVSAGVASLVAAAVLFTRNAAAEQVLLDITLMRNGEHQASSQMTVGDGDNAEIRINDVVRFIVAPRIRPAGQVLLSTQILEFDGRDYVLSAHPGALALDRQRAEMQVSTDRGTTFRIAIRPQIVHPTVE